ncbi:MAG: hypothetical protein GXP45_02400 [bacterium]|nr:hypothetical protein [bacterium]
MQNKNSEITNTEVASLPQYAVGDLVIASGTLSRENNFPYYTHLLKN